jgi:ketosteroid isomerase-like protein
MTTQEVAARYYEMYKQGKVADIQNELYSADIVFKEPEHAAAMGIPTLTEGMEAVKAKGKARMEQIQEVHGSYCTEPVVGGTYFSVGMGRDITFKNGQRRNMEEIAVFGVMEGKVVTETLFY